MADLTTLARVKRQIANSSGTMATTDDDLISDYVTQASQVFQTQCNRQFSETIGALTYDAAYPDVDHKTLYLGQDFLGVISITNGAYGTLTPNQYRLLPVNYSPKYAVELLNSAALSWQPDSTGFVQNAIQVVGTLGFCLAANCPVDITLAVTKLAAHLYETRDNNDGPIQTANGNILLPANTPQIVLDTIEKYSRRVSYS